MHEDLKARIQQLEQALAENRVAHDRLGSMLEKSNNQSHTYYNISKVIASTNDLDAMIPHIIGFIRKSINFDRVSVYLADDKHEHLVLRHAGGIAIPRTHLLSKWST